MAARRVAKQTREKRSAKVPTQGVRAQAPAAAKKTAAKKTAAKKTAAKKTAAKKTAAKKTAAKKTASPRRGAEKAVALSLHRSGSKREPLKRSREGASTSPQRPRKRLKKSVAARSVARAEALLQAEKDRDREKVERAKERIKKQKARAKERAKQAREERKARERSAREFARTEAVKERERIRAAARREAEEAKLAHEREKQRKAAVKAAVAQALRDEKSRRAAERTAARMIQDEARRVAAEARLAAKEHQQREKEQRRAHMLAEREAAAKARIDERERRLKEKEEAKIARERAQLEARAASARAKEEAKSAREKSRAEAALRKKAEAQEKRREQARLKQIDEDLKLSRKRQEQKLSASVTDLMTGLIHVLSTRPGVTVERRSEGPTLPRSELRARAEDVPAEILTWYHEVGPVDFLWEVPIAGSTEASPLRGQLEIPPLEELRWTPRGRYLLRPGPGATLEEWASLEQYLLRGLSTLFTWEDSRENLELLARTAIPRFTPGQEMVEHLLRKGLKEKVARGLLHSLGSSAHLVLHEFESEEGRRRREVLNAAAGENEISLSLLDALSDGPPVGKKEWKGALERHAGFLDRGGGGGSWDIKLIDGLPHAKYRQKSSLSPSGQASFEKENLQGLAARGARLSFANFCGSRASEVVFGGADLKGSCFNYGQFNSANFQGADLCGCDFSGARLASADFRKAMLVGTNFEGADLTNANFGGALTKGTRFGGANVRGIRY